MDAYNLEAAAAVHNLFRIRKIGGQQNSWLLFKRVTQSETVSEEKT